jgi:hypothetical protein
MELLTDPTIFGVFKIVGAAIALVAGIPFILGLVIGWMVGHRT